MEHIDIFTREQAIEKIRTTFPADSLQPATRDRGRFLLQRAREDCARWQDESDAVLFRYAELCEQEQRARLSAAERLAGAGL